MSSEVVLYHPKRSFSRYDSINYEVDACRVGIDVSVSRGLAPLSDPIGSSFLQGAAASHHVLNKIYFPNRAICFHSNFQAMQSKFSVLIWGT